MTRSTTVHATGVAIATTTTILGTSVVAKLWPRLLVNRDAWVSSGNHEKGLFSSQLFTLDSTCYTIVRSHELRATRTACFIESDMHLRA